MFGRELCHVCQKNKTRRRDAQDQPICADCEIQQEMDSEARRICPSHGLKMDKELLGDIIIDRCPQGNCVFLDGGELDEVQEMADDGIYSTNFAMGVAVGTAIN